MYLEMLCTIMCWTMAVSSVIFALSFGWSLITIRDHIAQEQTKADEIIFLICLISFIVFLACFFILTLTPLHTYGWYN